MAWPVNAKQVATSIPHGTVELIAENKWIAPGHTFHLGLHFQLEKGWHVYWINPGDSGEPPSVKWQLPAGLMAGELLWPTPHRLGTSNIVDFGYEEAVTLIVPFRAQASLAAQSATQLGAQVKVLVCREMCIPGKAQLLLTVPVQSQPPAADPRTRDLFARARQSLPRTAPAKWRCRVAESKDSFELTVDSGSEIQGATFFPLFESQIDNAAPQKLVLETSGFRLILHKSDRLLKSLERLKGVLTVSAKQSYWIDAPVRALAPTAASKRGAAKRGYRTGTHAVLSL